MKVYSKMLLVAACCAAILAVAQEQAQPAYGDAGTLKVYLAQWLGRKGEAQPVGTIPLLFDFYVGKDRLRFLELKDDGIYFTTDNIPTADRYIVLPIKPKLDSILEAGTVKDLLNAICGGRIQNVWSVFGSSAVKQFLDNKMSSGNVVIRVAYPSETHLSVLKIDFVVPPNSGAAEQRNIVQLNMQSDSITWLQGIAPANVAKPK